ncbi:uncharacterized protein LOC109807202 [Cajanus cajan]|uniref:uncharacterized protein LOC109807202 n=1 Tax=Cajanus cajan TaxID=3821 RepID=UPI00098DB497|nr:uncharacterized protein LOC109807202 [Cajanus cajan]
MSWDEDVMLEDDLEKDFQAYEELDNLVGNPLCPSIKVTKDEIRRACQPWKRSVIVKLLGKKIGWTYLKSRLLKLSNPMGGVEVMELDGDFFLVRFDVWEDVQYAINEGSWLILGHCLIVHRWHPGILAKIGNSLGRYVRTNPNTLKKSSESMEETYTTERARFARLCIEVDLAKVLVPSFEIQHEVYPVEYEGLNLVCFSCGQYGHQKDQCQRGEMEKQQKVAQNKVASIIIEGGTENRREEDQRIFGP